MVRKRTILGTSRFTLFLSRCDIFRCGSTEEWAFDIKGYVDDKVPKHEIKQAIEVLESTLRVLEEKHAKKVG